MRVYSLLHAVLAAVIAGGFIFFVLCTSLNTATVTSVCQGTSRVIVVNRPIYPDVVYVSEYDTTCNTDTVPPGGDDTTNGR